MSFKKENQVKIINFLRNLTVEMCSSIYCALSVGVSESQENIFTYFSDYCISEWEATEVTVFSGTKLFETLSLISFVLISCGGGMSLVLPSAPVLRFHSRELP